MCLAGLRSRRGREVPVRIVARSEADADVDRRAMIADRDRGTLATPSAVTVGEMLRQRQAGKTHLAVNTVDQYERAIAHLGDLHAVRMSDLGSAAVEAQIVRWERAGVGHRFREVAFRLLAEAVRVGQARGIVVGSPLEEVPRPRKPRTDDDEPIDTFNPREIRRICEAAEGYRYAAVAPLLFGVGLRIGEALGLRPDDLDLQAGTARIEQACKVERNRVVVGRLKTKQSRRTVPLPPEVCGALSDRLAEKLVEGNATAGLLFCTRGGGPPHPASVRSRAWYGAIERAGVRRRHPHQARHTFATLALAAGAPITAVAACMGDTIETVTRTYVARRA